MASDATLAVKDHKNRNKHAEANERMVYRKGLTDALQLERLDKRLGFRIGAKNERARLNKCIASKTVEGVPSTR
jgi:hypothetical protein